MFVISESMYSVMDHDLQRLEGTDHCSSCEQPNGLRALGIRFRCSGRAGCSAIDVGA